MSSSRRNSLSDAEVAIIKTLISGGKHSNQEIAGLINRARGDAANDISSGRISNIKNGQIKKYVNTPAASLEEVDQFLVEVALASKTDDGPISPARLSELLPIKSGSSGSLAITETDQIECKKSVNFVMKTIRRLCEQQGWLFRVWRGEWNLQRRRAARREI